MFYDLENPMIFVQNIKKYLHNDGIWVLEQSYLPSMLESNAFDTICHEHLEYYSMTSIYYLMKIVNFKIIDIKRNNINGGSFAITVAKRHSEYKECEKDIKFYLKKEQMEGYNNYSIYKKFYQKITKHKDQLRNLLIKLKKMNKKIIGYGASTKGNVILQFCNINNKLVDFIYDVNVDKKNKYTPGTKIKIIDKQETDTINFDYFLVLPWHFKDFILKKEKEYITKNIKFIFPLPNIIIV
jgi:hypothetical protein